MIDLTKEELSIIENLLVKESVLFESRYKQARAKNHPRTAQIILNEWDKTGALLDKIIEVKNK